MITPSPVPLVPCPTCRAPSPFAPANRWRPFCSERCRSADLGAWASESFRVPAAFPSDSGIDESGDPGTPRGPQSRH